MSFNVRYATEEDGPNRWDLRREAVFDTIRAQKPDILALQEVLASQAAELREALPDYGFIGVGREDGAERGEFVPILFRRQRFTLRDYGHFWLSERSQQPGSVGWDAALPRMATWVRLRFNDAPLREMQVLNVHFDHRGQQARAESAKLIRRLVESLGGQPIIVLGDFNCPPGSQPYRILTEDRQDLAALRDTLAGLPPTEQTGTYHAFTGRPRDGRIDWILVNRCFQTIESSVIHAQPHGRPPSDHFPVTATLRLSAAPAGFT
jgi:endonuclease/exonuclease/phosphatase family metal-dependent hydrolase